jgi:hypothetical protein
MTSSTSLSSGVWEKYVMALDDVTDRLERITGELSKSGVPYALVGGQAVALLVASRDPAAVRTTKAVDILLRRADLPRAKAAALTVEMDYFEVLGVGMFLDRKDPSPRKGIHLVWAGEKVRPENSCAAPDLTQCEELEPGKSVVSLPPLVQMKLVSYRDQDRVHLRDMIDVGLIDRSYLAALPSELATRLDSLLTDAGR